MIALAPLAPIASRAALALGGGALTKAVTRSVVNGAAFQAGAELVYQIAEWARGVDGDWDSYSPEGPNDGCYELTDYGSPYSRLGNGSWQRTSLQGLGDPYIWKWQFISNSPEFRQGRWVYNVNAWIGGSQGNDPNPTNAYVICATATNENEAKANTFKLEPKVGSCKESSEPGSEGPLVLPPIDSGDCIINTTFHGFLASPNGTGNVQPVFVMEPATNVRASGGVIVGACNFQPTIVVGGGGDGNEPPKTIPAPGWPTSSDPWWEYIVEGITGAIIEDIYNSIQEALFGQLEPSSFTLVAPCDKNEQEEPLTFTVDFPKQDYQARMEAWQIASAQLLQQHLDWKTPICRDIPKLEGDWRTISFRSAKTSPYGKSCLRKRFRYRSQSGIGLGELVNYWKDFTWESGPVIVKHVGSSWGTPQVWAATEDEGKRVIRHAAGEAGIDPDKVGRWSISSSSSPRYGVSAPMSVDTKGGYYWITSRDGSNGRPIVAETSNL